MLGSPPSKRRLAQHLQIFLLPTSAHVAAAGQALVRLDRRSPDAQPISISHEYGVGNPVTDHGSRRRKAEMPRPEVSDALLQDARSVGRWIPSDPAGAPMWSAYARPAPPPVAPRDGITNRALMMRDENSDVAIKPGPQYDGGDRIIRLEEDNPALLSYKCTHPSPWETTAGPDPNRDYAPRNVCTPGVAELREPANDWTLARGALFSERFLAYQDRHGHLPDAQAQGTIRSGITADEVTERLQAFRASFHYYVLYDGSSAPVTAWVVACPAHRDFDTELLPSLESEAVWAPATDRSGWMCFGPGPDHGSGPLLDLQSASALARALGSPEIDDRQGGQLRLKFEVPLHVADPYAQPMGDDPGGYTRTGTICTENLSEDRQAGRTVRLAEPITYTEWLSDLLHGNFVSPTGYIAVNPRWVPPRLLRFCPTQFIVHAAAGPLWETKAFVGSIGGSASAEPQTTVTAAMDAHYRLLHAWRKEQRNLRIIHYILVRNNAAEATGPPPAFAPGLEALPAPPTVGRLPPITHVSGYIHVLQSVVGDGVAIAHCDTYSPTPPLLYQALRDVAGGKYWTSYGIRLPQCGVPGPAHPFESPTRTKMNASGLTTVPLREGNKNLQTFLSRVGMPHDLQHAQAPRAPRPDDVTMPRHIAGQAYLLFQNGDSQYLHIDHRPSRDITLARAVAVETWLPRAQVRVVDLQAGDVVAFDPRRLHAVYNRYPVYSAGIHYTFPLAGERVVYFVLGHGKTLITFPGAPTDVQETLDDLNVPTTYALARGGLTGVVEFQRLVHHILRFHNGIAIRDATRRVSSVTRGSSSSDHDFSNDARGYPR